MGAGHRRASGGDREVVAVEVALASLVAGVALIVTAVTLVRGEDPPPVLVPPVAAGSATPTATAPPGRQLTVLGAGDLLVHPPVWEQAQLDAGGDGLDFRPIFADLADAVSGADLAICHLETPLAPPDGPFSGWPRFSAPPQLLPALVETGYDSCSTASNHTLDQGEQGVQRTIEALAGAGLAWTGSARDAAEAATPTVLPVETADGRAVAIGLLSYTFALNSGTELPAGKPWLANIIDVEQILARARAARDAGAEIVILSLHWGEEYRVDPTSDQLARAEQLIVSDDIDLILGHHAHVVQPVERLGDEWVVYGMGNQLARHAEPIDAQREGAMIRATFTERPEGWTVTEIEAIPTWVELAPDIRLVNLAAALASPDLTGQRRAAYREAFDRIVAALRSRGAGEQLAVPGVP